MRIKLAKPKCNEEVYQRLCSVIPGGVNSPVRSFPGLDRSPLVVDRAVDDTLIDCDGRFYFDLCCSWGALIHGHTPEPIVCGVQEQVERGISFGVTTELEEKLARKVVELVPSIDSVRFVSSGTEATMSAARLARGFTNRDLIVKFTGCYHGHADHFLIAAGSGVSHLKRASSQGVPDALVQHTISLPYNDVAAVEELFDNPALSDRVAGVIIEPVAGNMGVTPADPSFLHTLRERTRQAGALLIFDEVITGFRVGLHGAQALYDIDPDLTVLGKVVGGGFPVAAFGGCQEIMEYLAPLGPVYQAGTLSGNPVAMVAGYIALDLLDRPGFYEELERKICLLTDPIQDAIDRSGKNACLQRVGTMFTLFFGRRSVRNHDEALQANTPEFKQAFCYLLDRGIYIPPSPFEAWFITMAHRDEALQQAGDVIAGLF